jgi:hypothetical protein
MQGYAVAHEIGHLLLGSHSHSLVGIMRARWGRKELARAERELLFLREQAELIRTEVLRRSRQQNTIQIPALTLHESSGVSNPVQASARRPSMEPRPKVLGRFPAIKWR